MLTDVPASEQDITYWPYDDMGVILSHSNRSSRSMCHSHVSCIDEHILSTSSCTICQGFGAQVYQVETVVPIVDQGFSCEEESIADIAVTAISSEVWELCICCTTV